MKWRNFPGRVGIPPPDLALIAPFETGFCQNLLFVPGVAAGNGRIPCRPGSALCCTEYRPAWAGQQALDELTVQKVM